MHNKLHHNLFSGPSPFTVSDTRKWIQSIQLTHQSSNLSGNMNGQSVKFQYKDGTGIFFPKNDAPAKAKTWECALVKEVRFAFVREWSKRVVHGPSKVKEAMISVWRRWLRFSMVIYVNYSDGFGCYGSSVTFFLSDNLYLFIFGSLRVKPVFHFG